MTIANYPLGKAQRRALTVIRARGPITARAIADELVCIETRAWTILYSLEARGLIVRCGVIRQPGPGRDPVAWKVAP